MKSNNANNGKCNTYIAPQTAIAPAAVLCVTEELANSL